MLKKILHQQKKLFSESPKNRLLPFPFIRQFSWLINRGDADHWDDPQVWFNTSSPLEGPPASLDTSTPSKYPHFASWAKKFGANLSPLEVKINFWLAPTFSKNGRNMCGKKTWRFLLVGCVFSKKEHKGLVYGSTLEKGTCTQLGQLTETIPKEDCYVSFREGNCSINWIINDSWLLKWKRFGFLFKILWPSQLKLRPDAGKSVIQDRCF